MRAIFKGVNAMNTDYLLAVLFICGLALASGSIYIERLDADIFFIILSIAVALAFMIIPQRRSIEKARENKHLGWKWACFLFPVLVPFYLFSNHSTSNHGESH